MTAARSASVGSLPADEPCNTLGNEAGATWVQAISFALLFLSLIISAFNSQGASSAFVLSKADAQGGSGGDEVDEDESPGFRYSLSHVLLLLARTPALHATSPLPEALLAATAV